MEVDDLVLFSFFLVYVCVGMDRQCDSPNHNGRREEDEEMVNGMTPLSISVSLC